VPDPASFVTMVAGFAAELRAEGLPLGTGEVTTCCAALATLDPTDLVDLYWASRTTLVSGHEQIPTFDRVFRRYFLDQREADPVRPVLRASAHASGAVDVVDSEAPNTDGDDLEAMLGLVASDVEVWRNKAFAACTPEELAALRRIMSRVRLTPPRTCTRRTRPSAAGSRPDLRRTLRETMRRHGEPQELFWRKRKLRLRPLVLILDVSGSMADYSRSLLQFAYSTKRAATRVEVFCFGTRLTRITKTLERRRVDDAMDEAARAVFDWEGGTRIGDSLDAFVRLWGRRMSRGAIVVICSDGLDRGDPAVLALAMERLSRLCHRIVWLNPHKGNGVGFQPSTLGMMVAAPHVDLLLAGHDLPSLEAFASVLPGLG
jgi:uncharacterized protein with von Willebrand factor type A (vWA) domain